ncbi:hypothetical protein SUGI_1423490 [Cryptomeria japonica]|uniref:Uncharacterized protein n=1 Tax=Cryptomeria japonica TaxID=3369 RepID=A0AAD3NUH2_CRYJA|nr:hypothetical protein SUGI_1423490 [Cryptomeria japonica]
MVLYANEPSIEDPQQQIAARIDQSPTATPIAQREKAYKTPKTDCQSTCDFSNGLDCTSATAPTSTLTTTQQTSPPGNGNNIQWKKQGRNTMRDPTKPTAKDGAPAK